MRLCQSVWKRVYALIKSDTATPTIDPSHFTDQTEISPWHILPPLCQPIHVISVISKWICLLQKSHGLVDIVEGGCVKEISQFDQWSEMGRWLVWQCQTLLVHKPSSRHFSTVSSYFLEPTLNPVHRGLMGAPVIYESVVVAWPITYKGAQHAMQSFRPSWIW